MRSSSRRWPLFLRVLPAKSISGLRMSGGSALQETVNLLTACRPEELHKLEQLTGPKKVLTAFRCTPGAHPNLRSRYKAWYGQLWAGSYAARKPSV